jgi:uncharacterized protein (DUF2236 family)
VPSVLPSPDDAPGLIPRRDGPVWRAAGDLRLLAASGYALLLQVAHPTVGAGVMEHSNFREDPWGRLLRTLDYVNGSIYGGPRMAAEIGGRVRAMHKDINGVRPDGERYHALEPGAYAWVHATLASSLIDGHTVFGTPMAPAQAEEFWAEWRRLGRLIGVRERDLPDTWAGFRTYFDRVVDTELKDNPTVHMVLDTLSRPAPPPLMPHRAWRVLRRPIAAVQRAQTVGMLPPRLRDTLNLEWSAGDERLFRATAALSRAGRPFVRGPVRQFGPVYLRWRRRALERGDVARPKPRAAAA